MCLQDQFITKEKRKGCVFNVENQTIRQALDVRIALKNLRNTQESVEKREDC